MAGNFIFVVKRVLLQIVQSYAVNFVPMPHDSLEQVRQEAMRQGEDRNARLIDRLYALPRTVSSTPQYAYSQPTTLSPVVLSVEPAFLSGIVLYLKYTCITIFVLAIIIIAWSALIVFLRLLTYQCNWDPTRWYTVSEGHWAWFLRFWKPRLEGLQRSLVDWASEVLCRTASVVHFLFSLGAAIVTSIGSTAWTLAKIAYEHTLQARVDWAIQKASDIWRSRAARRFFAFHAWLPHLFWTCFFLWVIWLCIVAVFKHLMYGSAVEDVQLDWYDDSSSSYGHSYWKGQEPSRVTWDVNVPEYWKETGTFGSAATTTVVAPTVTITETLWRQAWPLVVTETQEPVMLTEHAMVGRDPVTVEVVHTEVQTRRQAWPLVITETQEPVMLTEHVTVKRDPVTVEVTHTEVQIQQATRYLAGGANVDISASQQQVARGIESEKNLLGLITKQVSVEGAYEYCYACNSYHSAEVMVPAIDFSGPDNSTMLDS